jgi:hypothetical protein
VRVEVGCEVPRPCGSDTKGGGMSEQWFVKCVNSDTLHTELNAFAQQGYVIRWLFQSEWQGASWITIVAERKGTP